MMLFKVPTGMGLLPVVCNNYLTPIRMPPFLMAAFLSDFDEGVAPQGTNDIVRVADGKPPAH
ncbi:MAG: hypothetical protein QOH70_3228 [Blastocatellia bacterium]|jgi:hypothetical protein|nr:hypothetical protein [Blastocatellia bacterium]